MKSAIRLILWSLLFSLVLGSCVSTSTHQVPGTAKAPVTIPADITGYGLILLRARVNNSQQMWFALDSGASFPFVIDSRRSKALRLKLGEVVTAGGGAGPNAYEVAMSTGVSFNLGSLNFRDQSAAVIGLGSLEGLTGRALDGLVGSDLFSRYVVELDYIASKIVLHDPETYTYSGAGESIPLTKKGDHFFVSAKIEMSGRPQLDGQFLVDTGGAFVTVVLNAPFAQSSDLPPSNQRMVLDRSLSGLGGETKVLVSRAKSFTLGKLVISAPVVYVSQDTGGALASRNFDGVIGGELLRKFKVIFDYARHRLVLEKNTYYAEPLEYDMSGIRLRAGGRDFRTFRVSQVLEESPASEARLREGDVLAAIDGTPAARFSLDEIYQMLKRQGREYKLTLKRGGETFSVKIKLQRLI